MLADQYGNMVGPANPSGMAVDAFGRARISEPFTLFDSFHRFQDNGRISQFMAGTANTVHDPNSCTIVCNIGATAGDAVKRESSRVFAYQPGKSLQILQTFVLSPPKAGLRQRYGYFNELNGIFLEVANNDVFFVERSNSSGSVKETRVPQSQWNVDVMDGTGPSGYTLDLSKAQIMFTDIEWLGLGSVRNGSVINGKLTHCHSFHHANKIESTYMGTACLPIRMEIENTANTDSPSTAKIVCTSVISEGGYEVRGRNRTAGMGILPADNYTLTSAGVYYPVMSIRLKSNRLDAIVLPKDVALVGTTASDYRYKIVSGATITGGSWISAGPDSCVEYNISAASMTGGVDLASSYLISTGSQSITAGLDGSVFKYQLERNSFTATPLAFTLAVASKSNGDKVIASVNWEEIT